jgi:hypothetical protein
MTCQFQFFFVTNNNGNDIWHFPELPDEKNSGYPVSTRDFNPSALEYDNTAAFSTVCHAMERAKQKVKTRCAYKSVIGKPDEERCGW